MREAYRGAGSRSPSPLELEHELVAVLVVPQLSGLDEAELSGDRERRLVVGRDRDDEAPDTVLAQRPADQRRGRLRRKAASAVGLVDRVTELDGFGILPAVLPRPAVEARMADRLTAVTEDDRAHEPLLERGIPLHLAQPQPEEVGFLGDQVGGHTRAQQLGGRRAVSLEESLEDRRRHRDELEPLRDDRRDAQATPARLAQRASCAASTLSKSSVAFSALTMPSTRATLPGGQTIAECRRRLPSSTWIPAEQTNSRPERSMISGSSPSSASASSSTGAASSSSSPRSDNTRHRPCVDVVNEKTSSADELMHRPLSHTFSSSQSGVTAAPQDGQRNGLRKAASRRIA